MDRLERMVERQGEQIAGVASTVATHVAICTKDGVERREDLTGIKEKLGELVDAAKDRAQTMRVARWVWRAAIAAVAGLWWFWEHVGPWLLKMTGKA